MMLALSRWVAAVPFLEDAAFRRRRADVWCGNAEALELGGCDHEEHAHLLAGLFLEAGRRAYVVLGTALQGAAAAFVLTSRWARPCWEPKAAAAAQQQQQQRDRGATRLPPRQQTDRRRRRPRRHHTNRASNSSPRPSLVPRRRRGARPARRPATRAGCGCGTP
jgi:hypothetical protein